MLITGSGIRKSFSERILFDNASFHIDNTDRIGFVGANGVGKTTLFKILIGSENYEDGELFKNKQLKIGYLDQYSCADSDKNVFDEVLTVYNDVIKIEQELEDIRFEIENNPSNLDALIKRQTELTDRFSEMDGYFYKSKVRSTITGLGFSEDELEMPVAKLSGGQKTRVELAKILLSDSNLLLLDEPTNHLDIKSVEWLEDFLKNYGKAFVVISHDRYFLDKVTNKTFEISGTSFYSFNGNYSSYAAQKEIDELTREREYENKMREIARLEDVIKQQRQWNREKNIKTAESKQKVVDKIKESLDVPVEQDKDITFGFKAYEGGGNDVLTVRNLSKSFDNNQLFSGLDFDIVKGEKIFLLGPNGCGKTTLLKIILGMAEKNAGDIKIGTDIHIGYYDQIQENLSPEKTIIDEIWDEYPRLTQTEIRNALAMFLFRGEDVFKVIKTLSGGERARVLLVKLILKRVNLLIMDEPTNHLDINSREALEKALASYGGTMIMVSHDRYFINKLSDRILYMTPQGIISYPGSYDDFAEKFSERISVKKETVTIAGQGSAAESYKEKKQRDANRRKAVNRFNKVEELIGTLEEENQELSELLESEEISTDYVRATEITEKMAENENELEVLMEEWEQLSVAIEKDEF